ncbi:MAG: hypothetical protein KF704_06580 [Crocinitomicaceae bacterium]|nr:hypothetical protein [Crocinitomicaceae bacterium]
MNSNLDNKFKDAFEQYELPYNPAAWDALNNRLDKIQQAPGNIQKPSSSGSGMKWIAGSAVVVIVSSALIFMFSTDDSSGKNKVAAGMTPIEQSGSNPTTSGNQPTTPETTLTAKDHSGTSVNTSDQKNDRQSSGQGIPAGDKSLRTEAKLPATTFKNTASDYTQASNPTGKTTASDTYKADVTGGTVHPNGDNHKAELFFPDIDYTICEHSSVSIANKNSTADLIITSPNGKEQVIPAGKTINYQTGEAGVYTITAKKQAAGGTSFIVKESPRVDFMMNDEIKYENGIPSIPLESYSDAAGFEWSFEGNSIKQYGTKAYAHFYKKGIHEITLTGKNSSGCKNSVTKSVTIDEDYNLLAPSAFMPQSDDIRKNKFIPIALTMRNTDFRLLIIEPRTGAVIYETTSKEGWDGIDRNTNRMVEENKSYAWKVILATPEPGEPKEYSGIVVRL